MPAEFIAAVSLIGAEVGSAALMIYSVEIGTALYYTAMVAASVTYGNSRKRAAERAARDAYNASLEDRLVMAPTVDGPRTRIYGRARNVDGIAFKASRGDDLEFYTLVISLAGHEVDAIETVYMNDKPVAIDAEGYVTTSEWGKLDGTARTHVVTGVTGAFAVNLPARPGRFAGPPVLDGSVTAVWSYSNEGDGSVNQIIDVTISGSLVSGTAPASPPGTLVITYDDGNREPRVRIRKYLGAPGQDLSAELVSLFPGLVTTADKFSIGPQLLVDLEYDPDIFVTGLPNFSAVMRGAKITDRRTGVTAWTRNPSVIADDWAQYEFGGTLPSTTLDDQQVKDAANACDVSTTFTDSDNNVTTAPLYTCDIVIPLDGQTGADRVMDDIVNSMAGRWGWSGGTLNLRAGIYRAPAIVIDESWLAEGEGLAIVPEPGSDDTVNVMKARIADAAQGYVAVPAPPIRVTDWITADGRELPAELTLPAVTDVVHAGHVQAVMLRERRNGLTIKASLNLRGLQLKLFTVVWVDLTRFGMDMKPCEVLVWGFSPTGGIDVMLKETAASIYTPDAVFPAIDATPNTSLPNPQLVPQIVSLTVASGTAQLLRLADGTIVPRALVSWVPVTDAAVNTGGQIEVQFKRASNGSAAPWETIFAPGTASRVYIEGLAEGDVITVRARAANALVFGRWAAHYAHKVLGKSEPPSNATGFTATVSKGRIVWVWDPCPDLDYASSELRLGGASWETAASLGFIGSANTWAQVVSAAGDYTARLKHMDTTGTPSTSAVSYTVTVAAEDLLQDGADGPAGAPGAGLFTIITDSWAAAVGGTITKDPGGSFGWDSQGYSLEAYTGGAFCSFQAGSTTAYFMGGLNSDPTADATGGSLDFAWYVREDGKALIYESAAPVAYLGSYTTSTVFSIVYDGATVRYFMDGIIKRTTAVAAGLRLAFDSSFYTPGGQMKAVRFGPVGQRGADGADGAPGEPGSPGTPGVSTAFVYAYRRASSTPSGPSSTATFTFATGALTGLNNSWQQTPPAGSDPLYVIAATAASSGASDDIAPGEWAAAQLMVQNGSPGSPGDPGDPGGDGINSATVYLFQRSGSAIAPGLPSGSVTYTFSSGIASGVNNGWSQSLPTSGGAYRWITTAAALSTGPNDTIAPDEWAAAALLAEDGAPGDPGAPGDAGTPSVSSSLTRYSVTFTADSTGLVDVGQSFTSVLQVLLGSTDDTGNWSVSRSASDGSISTGLSGATVTINGLGTGVDAGTVTVTATRSGYPTQTLLIEVNKLKRAVPNNGPVTLAGSLEVVAVTLSPSNATAKIQLDTNGEISGWVNGVRSTIGNWYLATTSGVGSAYEARFDLISINGNATGTTSNALSAWGALSSDRYVQVAYATNSDIFTQRRYSFAIRRASDGAQVSTGEVYLECSVEI